MNQIDNQVGELLKELRESKEWTMRQASENSGVSAAYISMLEKGIHSSTGKPIMITPEILLKFSAAYDYPYELLSMKAGIANYKNGFISYPMKDNSEDQIDHSFPKQIMEKIEDYNIRDNLNKVNQINHESDNLFEESLGERIIQLRETRHFTRTDLSNLIQPFHNTDTLQRDSFTIEQIESYEDDVVEPPLKFIAAISDLFNVSCDWIIKGKDFVIKSDSQNEEEQMLDVIKRLEEIVKQKYKSDPS